jgi:hypothetical protein
MLIAFAFLLDPDKPGGYLRVSEIPRAGDMFGEDWHIDHVCWYPGEHYIERYHSCGLLPNIDGPVVAMLHLTATGGSNR